MNTYPLGMFTGLMQGIERETHRGQLLSGFSFWPLGWILTVGPAATFDGAADVSSWLELDYNDKSLTSITLPAHFTHEYPGDFRRPDEYAGGKWEARVDV